MTEETKIKLLVLSGLIKGDELTPFWQDFTTESTRATRCQVIYKRGWLLGVWIGLGDIFWVETKQMLHCKSRLYLV